MQLWNSRCKLLALGVLSCLLITLVGAVPVSGNQPRNEVAERYSLVFAPADPEAVYEGARVVYDVTVNGQKGMRIHAKFRVRYGLHVPCSLIAYFFYDDAANNPLRSNDAKYRDKAGNVSAQANFTPAYDPAVYDDLQIFVPYSALNMAHGRNFDLKFYLALYDKDGGRFFGKSGWYKFKLMVP